MGEKERRRSGSGRDLAVVSAWGLGFTGVNMKCSLVESAGADHCSQSKVVALMILHQPVASDSPPVVTWWGGATGVDWVGWEMLVASGSGSVDGGCWMGEGSLCWSDGSFFNGDCESSVDNRDQKMLESLRAERKAKIDELKERTNYYTTQQLIQRYDLDPAAKAAAAAVLASKLGTDTGLKVYVGDQPKFSVPVGKSNDVELVHSDGLRNRRQPHARSHSTGGSTMEQFVDEIPPEIVPDGQEGPAQTNVVEHFRSPGTNDGGWIARIAAMLVGEDPTQSYALICGNCRMHNGLARKEDFPHINYYCPHCHALNGPRRSEELDSGSNSGMTSPPAPGGVIARSVSSTISLTEGEATSNLATVQESVGDGIGEESAPQDS
ncbi:hypothetical protein Taro_026387 [Colocasia esculenta]|uniref:Lunapark zinc ribbon domain-containing protein n=1 Tax=Colocasia esculenta TaxID=4460 RepID=A0A843VR59_COLES|nr:hypothetical protein [Colocasia esculenta]